MRTLVLSLVVVALAATAAPQRLAAQAVAGNAIYLELLGSGGVLSVNYERRIKAVQARIGYANWSIEDAFAAGSEEFVTVPITLSHLRGAGKHHLEGGAGVTIGTYKATSNFGEPTVRSDFVTLTGLVGYRYQKPGSGFVFRALFTPLYGLGDEETPYPGRGLTPSVGISFGAAFK